MKNIKKIGMKLLSIMLTVMICVQSVPMEAAAAQSYLEDIRLSFSNESAEKAKQWLTDNDYQIYDKDLNVDSGKAFVYMGYKTTENPEYALTDIKVMNMKGGFVVNDTAAEIQKMYSDLRKEAGYVMAVVEKFREANASGSQYADAARKALNTFTYSVNVGDDEQLLGDYLLEKATVEDIVQLMYFIEPMVSQSIYSALTLGILSGDHVSWIDKTIENTADSSKVYTTEEMDRANEIYPYVLAYGDMRRQVIDNSKALSGEEDDEVTEEDMSEDDDAFILAFAPYEATPFGEGSLSDFLANPDISVEELYPVAASITDEQVVLMELVGLLSFEPPVTMEGYSLDESLEMWAEAETVSVWDGVNREAYENPIAITADASNEMKLADEENIVLSALSNNQLALGVLTAAAVTYGVIMAAQGLQIYRAGQLTAKAQATVSLAARNIQSWTGAAKMLKSSKFYFDQVSKGVYLEVGAVDEAAYMCKMASRKASKTYQTVAARAGGQMKMAQASRASALKVMSRSSIVMILVLIGVSVYIVADTLIDYYNPKLTDIPYTMFDMQLDEDDEANYIRYNAVLSDEGAPGDLNGFGGLTWNALYTTKDPKAGKPILASVMHQSNESSTPKGYDNVSFFGYVTPADLNVGLRGTGTSHFLYFKRDTNFNSLVASAFAPPTSLIFIGAALVVGVLLGAGGMKLVSKRKKKAPPLNG